WLKRRDGRLMADVFLHNRLDVLSMAALTAHLTEMIAAEETGPARRPPPDLFAAARLLLHRGDTAGARRMLTELRSTPCPVTVKQACRLLSLIYKRAGKWPQAVEIWEEMIVQSPDDVFSLIELAKYHEHRTRDYVQALNLARQALQVLSPPAPEKERVVLQRRIARLERRLAKEADA
ncbi:MAG: hypothetical protein WCO89_10960, partial [Syntrophus sp. (in: bacteria)]